MLRKPTGHIHTEVSNRTLRVILLGTAIISVGATPYLRQAVAQTSHLWLPVALIVVASMGRVRYRWSPKPVSNAALWLAGLGIGAGVMGVLVSSPAIGWLGLLLFLALLADQWSDRSQEDARAWPVWGLLLLTLRPTLDLSQRLHFMLAEWVTEVTSRLMDHLGVMHHRLPQGFECFQGVISITKWLERPTSIYAWLFVAATIAVLNRRGILHALVLILAAVPWLIACTALELSFLTGIATTWDLSMTGSAMQIASGILSLLLGTAFLWSTDRLLAFITSSIPEHEDDVQPGRILNPQILAFNRWVGGGLHVRTVSDAAYPLTDDPARLETRREPAT